MSSPEQDVDHCLSSASSRVAAPFRLVAVSAVDGGRLAPFLVRTSKTIALPQPQSVGQE